MAEAKKMIIEDNIRSVSDGVKKSMKDKYGDRVRSIIIPLDDINSEEIEILVLVPTRSVVGQVLKFSSINPNKANEILVKNCLLTAKEEVFENDDLFLSTVAMLSDLIPIRQGKFGKV